MDKILLLHSKLNEANLKYYKLGGVGKNSDGLVRYEFELSPNTWGEEQFHSICIYSYIFGPHRLHEFKANTFEEVFKLASEALDSWIDNFDWENV